MNPLTEAEIAALKIQTGTISTRSTHNALRMLATIEHLQAELAGRKLDVEAANEECERQTELAKLSVRRMCEMAEPGWIGAFAARDHAVAELARVTGERDAQKTSKDTAYSERDRLICALSKVFPSCLERHPDEDTEWENDWRWIVFIEMPTGQATWHIHDSELEWFNHLPRFQGKVWDGHSTDEKYARIERFERIGDMTALARVTGERETVTELLEELYDLYENGDPCFEDGDPTGSAMGNAVKVSSELENAILAAIPSFPRPGRSIADQLAAAEQKGRREGLPR